MEDIPRSLDGKLSRNRLPDLLFSKINMVEPYPDNVAPVTQMADMTAFFPGGRGLWKKDDSLLFPEILVLGHDFSTEKWYMDMLIHLTEDLDSPTWLNLIRLCEQAGIDLNRCFFSNVFMGLRKTESMTGVFPGFKDKRFVKRNIDFLNCQINTIQPSLIITLGKYAAELLTSLAEYGLISWKGWQALKAADAGLARHVKFPGHACACVCLEHPSMRNSNVKRRAYKGLRGNDAEVMMLRDAVSMLL